MAKKSVSKKPVVKTGKMPPALAKYHKAHPFGKNAPKGKAK